MQIINGINLKTRKKDTNEFLPRTYLDLAFHPTPYSVGKLEIIIIHKTLVQY